MFDLSSKGPRPRGAAPVLLAGLAAALVALTQASARTPDGPPPAPVEGDLLGAEADGNLGTIAQHPEEGAGTSPLSVSLAGPAAPDTQEICDAGARWLRLRIREMTLRGDDVVELAAEQGAPLVFRGSAWEGRRFFTRALEGECVRLRAELAHPDSRVSFDALQSGRQDLALASTVVAAVGDLCDSGQECRRTAALVAALDPVKLILAGDNAYSNGTLAEYNSFYDPHYGPLKAKTHPAAGNHEYNTSGARGYFDYFNGVGVFDGPAGPRDRGYYSVDIGDWHVVALNTNVARGAGSAQEQWLRADLAASTKPCTLATFHHPRFSIGNYAPGNTSVQALYQALQDHRADVIITGHDHNYQRWAPLTATGARDAVNGVRQFVVGTGGRAFYSIGSSPNVEAANAGTWGVLKLTLNSADYTFEFLPVAGSSFRDSGSATCKPKGGGGAVTVAFTSLGAQDGRTWESTETSNVGGGTAAADSSASALRVGDLTGDRQYRSVVSFDTSSLPDGATITTATLRLVRGNLTGSHPFTSLGACIADARTGFFGSGTALASGDFQAAATASAVGSLSNPGANGAASTATLDAAGRAAINKSGTTQFRLYCTADDNDNNAYDYVGFYSGENAAAANRPQLIVTYTP